MERRKAIKDILNKVKQNDMSDLMLIYVHKEADVPGIRLDPEEAESFKEKKKSGILNMITFGENKAEDIIPVLIKRTDFKINYLYYSKDDADKQTEI